jgi:hypothetical protein
MASALSRRSKHYLMRSLVGRSFLKQARRPNTARVYDLSAVRPVKRQPRIKRKPSRRLTSAARH